MNFYRSSMWTSGKAITFDVSGQTFELQNVLSDNDLEDPMSYFQVQSGFGEITGRKTIPIGTYTVCVLMKGHSDRTIKESDIEFTLEVVESIKERPW